MTTPRRPRRILVLALATGLVLGPSVAHAIIPDPFELALLARIIRGVTDIFKEVSKAVRSAQEMKDRLQEMYPTELLGQIGSVLQDVRTVKDELRELACDWRFSSPVDDLQRSIYEGNGSLCKGLYQRVFGAPASGPDADLAEYLQWSSARRLNVVRSSVAVSDEWARASRGLGSMARAEGVSAGEAQRLSAIASAMQLQMEAHANTLAAETLSGIQEDLDIERQKDWRQGVMASTWIDWMVRAQSVVRRGPGNLGGEER